MGETDAYVEICITFIISYEKYSICHVLNVMVNKLYGLQLTRATNNGIWGWNLMHLNTGAV